MGVCPYNSWCKEEAIEVCVAVCMGFAPLPMVPEVGTQGALLHIVWKGWFMKPTSSVRYTILITIITKGNNQLCLWAGVKQL